MLHLDQAGLAGPPTADELSRTDEESDLLHFGNLFDQNEDASGELIDLATGRPYDNSTHTVEDDLAERGFADFDPHDDGSPLDQDVIDRILSRAASRLGSTSLNGVDGNQDQIAS